MNDNSMTRIVNAIREMNKSPNRDTMIYGEVKSVDPLKISIGHNIILTEKFLFLGQMLRKHKVKIPHKHQINGVTSFTPAVSGYSQTGTVHITSIDDEGNEQEEDEEVELGGAELLFEGSGTLTVTEPQGHAHVLDRVETEDVHKKDTDYEDYVELEIYPPLQEGDKVLMFAFNDFQMYYVAERIEKEDESEGEQ